MSTPDAEGRKPQPSLPAPSASVEESAEPAPKPARTSISDEDGSSLLSRRSRKQAALHLFAGTLFGLSCLTTKRAILARQRASIPPFYTSSFEHAPVVNGPQEALQALYLATLNCWSFTFAVATGAMWVFDISTLPELRFKLRSGMGIEGSRSAEELKEEQEEWVKRGFIKGQESKGNVAGAAKDEEAHRITGQVRNLVKDRRDDSGREGPRR